MNHLCAKRGRVAAISRWVYYFCQMNVSYAFRRKRVSAAWYLNGAAWYPEKKGIPTGLHS